MMTAKYKQVTLYGLAKMSSADDPQQMTNWKTSKNANNSKTIQ